MFKLKSESVIIKKIYHFDKGFDATETVIDGIPQEIKLSSEDDLQPVLLDFPDNWESKHKNFFDIYDYRLSVTDIKEIIPDNVYFLYSAGHVLFDSNREIVPIPYLIDYIGTIRQRSENDSVYDQIVEKLKVHPFVMDFSEFEIPYYNANFDGQLGICMKVLLTSDKQKELYNKCKSGKFWSVTMKDHIKMAHGMTGVYGDEIDNLLKEYWG